MSSQPLPIERILVMLTEAPPRIAALTATLQPAQLHTPPNRGEWSANEVLAHLRSCAEVWGGCIATILAQETPTIRAVSPRTWIKRTDYPRQPFHSSLDAYAAQRAELLAQLSALTSEAWSRAATVRKGGKPLAQTVHNYAERLAIHEQPHIGQLEEIANTMHR